MKKSIITVIAVLAIVSGSQAQMVATTSAATNVAFTNATANGSVSCRQNTVTACTAMTQGFVWGTSRNRASDTEVPINVVGLGGVITKVLIGLTENTTYYYWTYLKTKSGTTYGELVTFKTLAKVAPTASTVTNITATTATCGANANPTGTAARGVIWSLSTTQPPLTTTSKCTAAASAYAAFSCGLTGLIPSKTYSYWAFVTYSDGTTMYSGRNTFVTLAVGIPVVTTKQLNGVLYNSVDVSGEVTNAGNSTVTARGMCWGLTPNPTLPTTNKTVNGTGMGSFSASLPGLLPRTTYHVRAYATNTQGTGYGADLTFTTPRDPRIDLTADFLRESNGGRGPFYTAQGSALVELDDGAREFYTVIARFCTALPAGTLVQTYTTPSCAACQELKHTLPLPPVRYVIKNEGDSIAGAFLVELYLDPEDFGIRKSRELVDTHTVPSLAAGASVTFSFTPPESVDIYTFPNNPDAPPGSCFVPGPAPFLEWNYNVFVDNRNAQTTGGDVPERDETNNFVQLR